MINTPLLIYELDCKLIRRGIEVGDTTATFCEYDSFDRKGIREDLHRPTAHMGEVQFSFGSRNLWMRCYTTLVSPTCSTSGIVVLSDVGLYIVLIDDILDKN